MKITQVKPKKGYGYVQTEVMTLTEISYGAKALYAYFCAIQGGNKKSWKSNESIMKDLNISKNYFYKLKKELLNIGLISSKNRFENSCEISINYIEESTLKRDSSNPSRSDSLSTLKSDSCSTLKGDPNINIEYKGDEYELNEYDHFTNEGPEDPRTTEIANYLLSANHSIGLKPHKWKLNKTDIKNIKEDLQGYDLDYIKAYIDSFISKHRENIKKGTTNLKYIYYSTIHKNLK